MNVNFNPSVKTNTNFQAVSQKYLKTAKKCYEGYGNLSSRWYYSIQDDASYTRYINYLQEAQRNYEELAKELEKERSEKEKEKSLNQSDDSSTEDAELEDIKFIIKTIGQAVRFVNGEEVPDPEADKVMEDLDKGFKAGYDASKQYEEMLEAASSVEKTVDFFTSFFFGGNTSLAFFLSCIFFHDHFRCIVYIIFMGYKPFPYAIYRILLLTFCRLIYFCFFATPIQIAVLRHIL